MMVYDLDDRQEELYYVTGAPEANWPDGLSFLPSSRDEMRDAFVGFHPIVSNANTWLRGNENPDWVYGYDVFTTPLVSAGGEPALAGAGAS